MSKQNPPKPPPKPPQKPQLSEKVRHKNSFIPNVPKEVQTAQPPKPVPAAPKKKD
jgi:hypothetical protein